MTSITEYIGTYLPVRMKKFILSLSNKDQSHINEIRLRQGNPLCINIDGKIIFADQNDIVSNDDIAYCMKILTDFSLNSVKNQLNQGFIPLKYGCRVGLSGHAVMKNGNVEFLRNISSINFRIAHEKKGCANEVIQHIIKNNNIQSTLIISPPMMGKTTFLRDVARLLSNNYNVVIIDERSEIASCYNGTAQFDVGKRTDILDSYSKKSGIGIAIRCLSPDVIITDELGNMADGHSLSDAALCGIGFVASMHSENIADAMKRNCLRPLLENKVLKNIIRLGSSRGIGTIEEIQTGVT